MRSFSIANRAWADAACERQMESIVNAHLIDKLANPAVTLARTLSDTFAGIAPSSVPGCVVAQALGAVIACGVIRVLWPAVEAVAQEVVAPHEAVDGQPAAASHR